MRLLSTALLLGFLLVLGACGDVDQRTFGLDLRPPAVEGGAVPFRVAVIEGTAVRAARLQVRIEGEHGAVYSFPVVPGTTLAFSAAPDAPTAPVLLPGLESGASSPDASLAAVRARFEERSLPARISEKASGEAYLVRLEDDREDRLAEVLGAATGSADLRFLMQVLPKERYRSHADGRIAPRLEQPPYPWEGTAQAFDAFKASEVERWKAARAEAKPYQPSDARYLVLPKYGIAGDALEDFIVLEWPPEERFRFDHRMLENGVVGRDQTYRPAVYYDIRESFRAPFAAWTKANVGLPMAIVRDWTWTSAPTIQSALSDSVQITLGSGSNAELQDEAERMVDVLQAAGATLPTRLVALARWGRDGALEVWLPLDDGTPLSVAVEATDQTEGHILETEVAVRFVPGAPSDGRRAASSAIAGVLLDAFAPDDAGAALRAWLPDSVEAVAEVLGSDLPTARRVVAADLLGRIDLSSEVARDALLAALQTPQKELRWMTCEALGRLDAHPEQLAGLEVAVGDPELGVRRAAMEALARAGADRPETLAVLLRAAAVDDPRTSHVARQALTSMLPEARGALEAAAAEGEPRMRAAAIMALGTVPDALESLAFLAGYLDDPAVEVRRAALSCLASNAGMLTPDPVAEHAERIAKRLDDADEGVKSLAAHVLSSIGGVALTYLVPLLQDPNGAPESRARIALVLANQRGRSPGVTDALEQAAADPELLVRLAASAALVFEGGGDERLLGVLREALTSTNVGARAMAASIVLMRAEDEAYADLPLAPLLDDPKEEVRVQAAIALEQMGRADEQTKAVLQPIRDDPEHPLHGLAAARE